MAQARWAGKTLVAKVAAIRSELNLSQSENLTSDVSLALEEVGLASVGNLSRNVALLLSEVFDADMEGQRAAAEKRRRPSDPEKKELRKKTKVDVSAPVSGRLRRRSSVSSERLAGSDKDRSEASDDDGPRIYSDVESFGGRFKSSESKDDVSDMNDEPREEEVEREEQGREEGLEDDEDEDTEDEEEEVDDDERVSRRRMVGLEERSGYDYSDEEALCVRDGAGRQRRRRRLKKDLTERAARRNLGEWTTLCRCRCLSREFRLLPAHEQPRPGGKRLRHRGIFGTLPFEVVEQIEGQRKAACEWHDQTVYVAQRDNTISMNLKCEFSKHCDCQKQIKLRHAYPVGDYLDLEVLSRGTHNSHVRAQDFDADEHTFGLPKLVSSYVKKHYGHDTRPRADNIHANLLKANIITSGQWPLDGYAKGFKTTNRERLMDFLRRVRRNHLRDKKRKALKKEVDEDKKDSQEEKKDDDDTPRKNNGTLSTQSALLSADIDGSGLLGQQAGEQGRENNLEELRPPASLRQRGHLQEQEVQEPALLLLQLFEGGGAASS